MEKYTGRSTVIRPKKEFNSPSDQVPLIKPLDTQAVKKRKCTQDKSKRAKVQINEIPSKRLEVLVFGEGSSGELGLGSAEGQTEVTRPRSNPNLAADKVGVVALAVGGMHTVALTHDNKILTWGVNDEHALGRDTSWEGGLRDIDGPESDYSSEVALNPKESTPGEVDLTNVPKETMFSAIVATDNASFALASDGQVFGWGTFRSDKGIFGYDQTTKHQEIPKLVPQLENITTLAAGANHVLALDIQGRVHAWGSGQQLQLGRRFMPRQARDCLTPRIVGLPRKIVHLGTGEHHSFAIHEHGDVYAWGLNGDGQTGIPGDLRHRGALNRGDMHYPLRVESLSQQGRIKGIQGGMHHSIAVTTEGRVLVWGRVDKSQAGIKVSELPADRLIYNAKGNPAILAVPSQVPNIKGVMVSAGTDHCIAIDEHGKAFSWGFNATCQLGQGDDEDVEVAEMIDNTALETRQLVWAGAGSQFSIVASVAAQSTSPVTIKSGE